ncbi:MAG: BamA/TamA family outer membrane protein [Bacteroidota bacterium]
MCLSWPISHKYPAFTFICLVVFLFVCASGLYAQTDQKTFKQDDVWSIFTRKKNAARRDSITQKPIELYKPYLTITPFIGYNPAYGMLIGAGGSIGIYLGPPETTPISSVSAVVNFTSKAQKIFNLRTNIITNESRYIWRGDWRFLIFSQPTYGLGSGIKHSGVGGLIFGDGGQSDPYSGETQPINYDYIRLYETFYFRVIGKFYFGLGYCLDNFSNIKDHRLNLDTVPQQITSHYKYSIDNDFNPGNQTMSGIKMEVLLDSRDHTIRPTSGYFANLAFRPNFTFLGSSRNSLMVNTEFRTFLAFSKVRRDHLIAFWYMGQFTQKGRVPYLGLPAIGWDMYNRQGRGYVQGSIRGVNFLYSETEYRFPISQHTGILGGIIFVNATTASSDDGTRKLFEYIDPAAGFGLRVMFSRKTLSNLSIDCGFGKNGSIGIYFNLNETF